jgi:hypothetical protein
MWRGVLHVSVHVWGVWCNDWGNDVNTRRLEGGVLFGGSKESAVWLGLPLICSVNYIDFCECHDLEL